MRDLASLSRGLSRTISLFDPYSALREIALQDIRRAGLVSEGNIAVRPDEVERIPCKTGLAVLPAPCKLMERQAMLSAP